MNTETTRGRWSAHEEHCLRELWGTKNSPEIAKQIGRTAFAVRNKAQHLGLTAAAPRRDVWRERDKITLKAEWLRGVAMKFIAHRLGRTAFAVRNMAARMGLPRRQFPAGQGRVKPTAVFLDADLKRKANKRAMQREQTLSAYLRYLVQRDVG